MWTNLQDAEDLFTFTEETLNGKFHFLCSDSNFKHKMKRLQIPQKRAYEKFYVDKKIYVHDIAAVNLSKIYFLKIAKKTCKPNTSDLNRD